MEVRHSIPVLILSVHTILTLTGLFDCTALAPPAKQQDSFYFDPTPVNQDVVEGKDVTLRCDVSNRRLITFYWTLNGKQLLNTSRRFQEGSDLKILWVDKDLDNGSLRCIATNSTTGIALTSAVARLNIFWIDKVSKIELKQPKGLDDIAEGVELLLKCQADGNPETTVEWFKNKIRLFSTDRIKILKNRLRITALTVDDNGVYSCKARNLGGQSEYAENFLLAVPGQNVAQLNVATFSSQIIVKQLEGATFNCEFTNAIKTEWYRNEQKLSSVFNNKYLLLGNGSLLVRHVDVEDAGVYLCVGVTLAGSQQRFSVDLVLAYLDEMNLNTFGPTPSAPQVIPLNGKFEIRCRPPLGLPVPSVRWKNPYGVEIIDQDRIKSSEGVLSFQNVHESDSGNYTCHTENIAGQRQQSVWVVVSVSPKISRPPISSRVGEGDMAVFDCKVTGTPYPVTTISWKYEDQELDKGNPRFDIDESSGELKIKSALLSDEGNYGCLVITEGYQAIFSTNAHLYVEKKLKFKPIPSNTMLDLGQPGKIPCSAEGQTPPSIRWIREGQGQLGAHIYVVDGVMFFKAVESGDVGSYTCLATNEQGTINVTVKVNVVARPRFRLRPQNTHAVEGESVLVHCSAVGDPQPQITWDKNGRVDALDPLRFQVFENGSLFVSQVLMEDSGHYGCSAENVGGVEREDIHLTVFASGTILNSTRENKDGGLSLKSIIIIATCSVIAYLALVVVLIVYCTLRLLRSRRNKKQAQLETNGRLNLVEKKENGIEPTEQTELMNCSSQKNCDVETRSRQSGNSSHPSHASHPSHTSYSSHTYSLVCPHEYDRLTFPRNQLQTVELWVADIMAMRS